MKRKELEKGLAAIGLKKNDIVVLHSSLSSLGEIEGGADGVIDAFMKVLGKGGTLIVPAFGKLGVITEKLQERPGAVISDVPVGTLAAIGGRAEELLSGHWDAPTAHGEGTPFLKIAKADGYVCLLGVDLDRNTMLHSAEALLQLPYLCETTRECTAPNGKKVTRTWKYYPGPHRNFIGLDHIFEETGVMTVNRVGNAQVRLLKASEMLNLAQELGDSDPAFVLCNNPACADCVRQRAAISRDRFAAEDFTVAASSRLCGRYVPEMIENLAECGIDHIELDFIQGMAAAAMTTEALAAAVRELEAAGIVITGLRMANPPDDWDAALEKLAAAGIKTILLPLSATDVPFAKLRRKAIAVSFYNCHQSSRQAAVAFAAQARAAKDACGFTMNPAAFAQAAEKPFLTSWKIGRFARCITQLDVVDCLWDGTPKALANGNAEIRELISILRCRCFSGTMTLGGGATCPGSLKQAANEFLDML